jgi:hypothetical protein
MDDDWRYRSRGVSIPKPRGTNARVGKVSLPALSLRIRIPQVRAQTINPKKARFQMNHLNIVKSVRRLHLVGLTHKTAVAAAVAALALLCNVQANAANPIFYSSGFEEATIAPFWTVTDVFGSASLSKDVAYDGTHSVKFQSSSGGNRAISVVHSFSVSTRGTVSIAFYDYAPGQETLYEQLNVYSTKSPGSSVSVGTMDFDSQCYEASMVTAGGSTLGPNALCGFYPQQSTSPVKRTAGWHIFTIAVGAASTEIAIDGVTVFVGPVYWFDTIRFEVSGPSWRPNTVAYIDDFAFAPLSY